MSTEEKSPEELLPHERDPEGPVGWLLGPQFIASLKWMLLYTGFGTKLDARDWMKATVFPQGGVDGALYAWYDRARKHPENEKLQAKDARDFWEQKGEFWFDYMADTGDGQKATYSIAYLCLNTLWAKKPWEAKPPRDADLNSKYPDRNSDLILDHKVNPEQTELTPLPRGEFLFVGGDISYHMSDYLSLYTRFWVPFSWAFKDFTKDMERGKRKFDEARRPLFGIPGNHDYYDMLDGFRRQFRRPVHTEEKDFQQTKDKTTPQLIIPGYERQQESSYVAIRLPFDWWFWALDTEVGEIDERQKKFFRGLNKNLDKGLEREILPDKLIVATCAPTTVFGQYAKEDDEKASLAFLQLGLPRLFLPDLEKHKMAPGEVPRTLGAHQIRLDISGDVHHYARYWGPQVPAESEDADTPPRQGRKETKASRPKKENYASVVSGMGGAFLHPTTTYKDEVHEQVLYPPEIESRGAVAIRIFNPLHVARGGYVWLIGGLIAFLLYLILAAVPSTRQSINSFTPLVALGITQKERVRPTVRPLVDRPHEGYYIGENALKAPWSYYAGLALAVLSVLLIIITFIRCEYRHANLKKKEKREKRAHIFIKKFDQIVYPMTALTIFVIALTLILLKGHRAHMTPFANSAMVLLSMLWGLSALGLSFRYSDWLFEHAANAGKASRRVPRVLMALAGIAPVLGLWLFGRNNQPAYLFTDILFILIVSLVTLLLIYAAARIGGQMLSWKGKVLMGFGGAWHALLQIVLPLLLIRRGTWLTLVLLVLAVLVFMKLGEKVMRAGRAGLLAVLGFLYGVLMLALPYLAILLIAGLSRWLNLSSELSFLFWPQAPVLELKEGWFASYEWWALREGKGSISPYAQAYGWWVALVPALLAGAVGALMSCVWFGWYLAISLAFNGHNNEAGGAARIEDYKEFVRIRLTKDSLTAYVIGVDVPKIRGSELEPKLIDVFCLRLEDKGSASS